MVLEKNVCNAQKDRITISLNYIEKAIKGFGEYDPHFSALVAHQLDFAPLLFYFAFCNKALGISVKYG